MASHVIKNIDLINAALNSLDQGTFKAFSGQHPDEAQFVLKVLFFGQMKARQKLVNLIAEGIKVSEGKILTDSASEINNTYLTPIVSPSAAMSDDDVQALFTRINGNDFDSITKFLDFLFK